MSEWRFLAYRPDGQGHETLLHPHLPVTDARMVKVLSGVNSLDLTINPKFIDLMADDGLPLFKKWGTFIYAERDGIIQGGFIVKDVDAQGPKLELRCVGFLGFAQDTPYSGEMIAYEVDPLDMARHIWAHIQSAKGGNIGLVLDPKNTGGQRKIGIRPVAAFRGRPAITTNQGEIVLPAAPATPAIEDQPVRFAWYESHDLWSDFVKIAQESPVDFVEQHWWEFGEIMHYVEFDYPRRGNRRPLLRFAIGENVFEPPKLSMVGEQYASNIMVLGAGEGSKMLKAVAEDHSQGLLRRTKVIKNAAIGRMQTAQNFAIQQLALYKGDFEVSDLVVKHTEMTPYGSFDVGDEIRVITSDDEWVENRSYWVRVLEIEVSPGDGDDMQLIVSREGVAQ